jgi:signal transduction histidine kinase/HAMP domain-containing protein
MKIKTKLIIGFSLLLILMVGITSFGYERLTQMNNTLDNFYNNRFEKVKVALEVRGEINASARVINDIILEDADPKEGVKEITKRLTNAGKQYKTLSEMDLPLVEQEKMDDVIKTSEGYVKSLKQFIDLVNQGKVELAKKIYTDSLRGEQRRVIDSMDGLVKFQETALKEERTEAKRTYDWSVRMVAILTLIGLLLGFGIVLWVFPSITKGLNLLERMADRFGKGRLRGFSRFEIKSQDELGELAQIFKRIALDLQVKNEREASLSEVQKRQGRMNAQIARVTELLQQRSDVKHVAQVFISEFAPVLGASYGLIYLMDPVSGGKHMELSGSYATLGESADLPAAPAKISRGEGLVGQCYRDAKPIMVNEVPDGYVKISSGLGAIEPVALMIQPILYDNTVIGVVELATMTQFNAENRELLVSLCDKFATIVNNIRSRQRVEELLRESQAMTEELQVQSEELICQQEELRETNDKLEGQQNDLKNSEQLLQQQQEELEHTNQQLMVKTVSLEEHINRMELQNSQIAQVNSELERQAIQLAMTSKYKSEFLANMSHELRTPLNSLLILSEFLAENKEENLTDKQQEYMRTIHDSGNDLLKMIDEILDLSKVDAGKMDIHTEWMVLDDVANFLNHMYTPMAAQKSVLFAIRSESDIPNAIWTDGHRLKQIMRNLLSNAFKFTEKGSVSLTMRKPSEQELQSPTHKVETAYVAFSVQDTGIGIPAEKSGLIFEAFRQADGTTSRKYGGTGLGLTISRELARLLGGWIHLETEAGKGSTFTLVLPERLQDYVLGQEEESLETLSSKLATVSMEASLSQSMVDHPQDDRSSIADEGNLNQQETSFAGKKILLVDDDVRNVFALTSILEHRQMTVVYAENGRESLNKLESESGIDLVLMDIMMPEMDGYEAMRLIRANSNWNAIPIIALTAKAMKDDRNKCIEAGASDYITKPVNTDQLLSLMRVWLHQ